MPTPEWGSSRPPTMRAQPPTAQMRDNDMFARSTSVSRHENVSHATDAEQLSGPSFNMWPSSESRYSEDQIGVIVIPRFQLSKCARGSVRGTNAEAWRNKAQKCQQLLLHVTGRGKLAVLLGSKESTGLGRRNTRGSLAE